jgi:hypothetical protein
MDPKNLSKQKYIYRLYQASDDRLHIEKFPVIYANKNKVYFKVGEELAYHEYKTIFSEFADIKNFTKYTLRNGLYFWTEPDLNCNPLKTIKIKQLEKKMMDYGQRIYRYHEYIEEYEAEVDKIKKQLEALNGNE